MRQPAASMVRIILVFVRRFGLATLLVLAATGSARAQGGYSLRMTLDYQGRSYNVAAISIAADQRTELNVDPVGALRVYVRALTLPGVPDQVLLDMQVYEPRGSSQAQVSSFTMPAYLGTANSTEMKTVYGPLLVRAYVDLATAGGGVSAPPRPAATPSMRAPTPFVDQAPVRPQALPQPLPSPLPPPGN